MAGRHPRFRAYTPLLLAWIMAAAGLVLLAVRSGAQTVAHAAVPAATASRTASVAALHMEMSPFVPATKADSLRAARIARTLRAALMPFRDTSAAVAAGYRMFAPKIRDQTIYHFTSSWRGMEEAFRFDAAKPTSLLYTRGGDGRFTLVGAMYTAPKRFGPDKLDARVPLSVAKWHKHINWCLPPRGATDRWMERHNGEPVFGPESPIATKDACDAAGGIFRPNVFGWMVHANVMLGDDPATIWGSDEHAGHDMHAGMKMDGM